MDFQGVLQSDGYAAYGAFARERGQAITLAGCWAHARRGFHEALQSAPRDALLILRQIGNLYAIERRQRACRAGPRLRALAREVEGRPVLERLGQTLRRWKLRHRHPFGCAQGLELVETAAAKRHGPGHRLRAGPVARAERLSQRWPRGDRQQPRGKRDPPHGDWKEELALHPFGCAQGTRGDAGAGERGAILYSIVESCRRRGLDPYRYLREVLTALPTLTNWQVKDWTPEVWAKAQRPARKAA